MFDRIVYVPDMNADLSTWFQVCCTDHKDVIKKENAIDMIKAQYALSTKEVLTIMEHRWPDNGMNLSLEQFASYGIPLYLKQHVPAAFACCKYI